jgi:hypothetical protein
MALIPMLPDLSGRCIVGFMIPVIALTQFAFTAIGSVAVILLMHSQALPEELHGGLRGFLTTYTFWMLLVPVVWMFAAGFAVRQSEKAGVVEAVRATGVAVTVALAAIYTWVILSF